MTKSFCLVVTEMWCGFLLKSLPRAFFTLKRHSENMRRENKESMRRRRVGDKMRVVNLWCAHAHKL